MRKLIAISSATAALCAATGAFAGSASISVTPSTVAPGHVVTISGSVGSCPAGHNALTLYSRAFSNRHSFAGVPATYATVHHGGAFSKRVRIPSNKHAGHYSIGGRCGGGNIGVHATLVVS
jgi:hypothetical protein